MRAFIAGGALVAAIFFWDSTHNHHRLTTHAEAMLRDIGHHVFR